jgi:hypothetical protein
MKKHPVLTDAVAGLGVGALLLALGAAGVWDVAAARLCINGVPCQYWVIPPFILGGLACVVYGVRQIKRCSVPRP